MRSALLLQFVDVYDGGAGVGIGIFYIDDAGKLLFLLLYFSGCGIADEVSVSFLSVCFAKGRQQVSPAAGVSSGLLLLAAVVDSSSGRRGRRWRIQSSFLLFGGTADVLSTKSKRCGVMARALAALPKLWGSSTRRMEEMAGLRWRTGGTGEEDGLEDFLVRVRYFSFFQGVLCKKAEMYCNFSV